MLNCREGIHHGLATSPLQEKDTIDTLIELICKVLVYESKSEHLENTLSIKTCKLHREKQQILIGSFLLSGGCAKTTSAIYCFILPSTLPRLLAPAVKKFLWSVKLPPPCLATLLAIVAIECLGIGLRSFWSTPNAVIDCEPNQITLLNLKGTFQYVWVGLS